MSNIPDREGPLTVKPVHAVFTFFLVQMKDHFGVRPRGESVAFLEEFLPQFTIIKNFAVKRNPDIAASRGHRLSATCEINDTEPRVR